MKIGLPCIRLVSLIARVARRKSRDTEIMAHGLLSLRMLERVASRC
jgi:hypothetical protein